MSTTVDIDFPVFDHEVILRERAPRAAGTQPAAPDGRTDGQMRSSTARVPSVGTSMVAAPTASGTRRSPGAPR